MSMIEKVARAICRESTGDEKYYDSYFDRARAAIAAMREPTDFMVNSALAQSRNPLIVWLEMIDAALKE